MKLNAIMESQLQEVRRWTGRGGEERYDSDFADYLRDRWSEDYISVYDALDGYAGQDDWYDIASDAAEKAGFADDIQDLKISKNNSESFRKLVLDSNGDITPDIVQVLQKFAMTFEDFEQSDEAEEYRDDFHDSEELADDPYKYYGVRRSDFY